MGVKKNLDDKPELRTLTDEKMDKLIQEFEEDSKTHDYSDPEMDKFFHNMIDDVMRKSRRKRVAKVASIAAGVVIALGVALNGFTEVTYGESLIDIIRNSIEGGKFTITAFSKNDDSEFEEYDTPVIQYEATSIEELFKQITNDTQIEISELFYIQNVPNTYQQWIVRYDKEFQKLTINSRQGNSCLYIYEELDYEDVVSGTILEAEIVSTVFNENLQLNIDIVKQMDDVRNQGYYFEVFCTNKRLLIEGNGTLKEFENIAKNLFVWKRG